MAALRDVLSCPVCTETFETEGDRKPKMTRCFHTFCLDCITQLVRLGKPCPTCRAELGIQNASELPNNFTLIQTLEAMEEEKPVLPSAPPPPFFHDAAPAPAVPLRSGPVLIFINGLNWPEDLVERQRIENESAIALRENYGAGTEIVFLQNKTFPTEQAKKIHSMIDTMQSSLMSIVPESTAGKVLLGGLFMAAAFGFREQVKKVGSALTAETKRSLENAATLLGNDLLELLQIYSDRRICLVAHSHGAMGASETFFPQMCVSIFFSSLETGQVYLVFPLQWYKI